MSQKSDQPSQRGIIAAVCVGRDAINRFGRTLRHMAVGMVDESIHVRLVSADRRAQSLTLGPIQAFAHEPLVWPLARRRLDHLIESLSAQPPNVVHALAAESYETAREIAVAFEAELVVLISSHADCQALLRMDRAMIGCFVPVSQPLSDLLEHQMGIARERIELIRPGVLVSDHVACFSNASSQATLVNTCPLNWSSGVQQLIEALGLLRDRGDEVLAFLMGRGSCETGLRKIVRAHGLASTITFANPTGDYLPAMENADIFVRTSPDEAFTGDPLQAMASGMAVVASPADVSDYVQDGENGIVCKSSSAEAIAEAVATLLHDRPSARQMAAAGVEYVRAHHAVSRMAEGIAGLYRRLALRRTTFPIRR